MIHLLCAQNSQPFVAILRYLGSKGRTKQIVIELVAGHVQSVRPPFNTCKTKSFESKSVVKTFLIYRSSLVLLSSVLSCRVAQLFAKGSPHVFWPLPDFPRATARNERRIDLKSTADGVIWLAGVINKRSNKGSERPSWQSLLSRKSVKFT